MDVIPTTTTQYGTTVGGQTFVSARSDQPNPIVRQLDDVTIIPDYSVEVPVGAVATGSAVAAPVVATSATWQAAFDKKPVDWWTRGLYILGGLVLLIFLIAVAILLYMLFTRPKVVPNTCVSPAGCPAGFFCSHSGTCIPGGGGTSGQPCGANDDCRLGLTCVSGVCSVDPTPPPVPDDRTLTAPSKFKMCTQINCDTYYLDIRTDGAVLTNNFSTENLNKFYEYSTTQDILEYVFCSDLSAPAFQVGVEGDNSANNGSPFIKNGMVGEKILLQGTLTDAIMRLPCGSILEFVNSPTVHVYPETEETTYPVYFPKVPVDHCDTFPASGGVNNQLHFNLKAIGCELGS